MTSGVQGKSKFLPCLHACCEQAAAKLRQLLRGRHFFDRRRANPNRRMVSSHHRVLRSLNMKPKNVLALGVFLVGVTTAASLPGAQRLALPQLTEQEKLKERVEALESQSKEAEAKADRAALEKDRIDKIQQHYEDYYEKVHTTEMHVLEAITAVFALFAGFAALFGFSVFDQRIQNAISKATTNVETKFDKNLGGELEKLKDSNAAQMKQLEDDLRLRSAYGFEVLQALSLTAAHEYAAALHCCRNAVRLYKLSKARQLFVKELGPDIVQQTFSAIKSANPANFREAAKQELANPVYDGLEEELAQAALQLEWLVPFLKERKPAPPAAPPATPTPASTTSEESPTPAPDQDQSAKPHERKNK